MYVNNLPTWSGPSPIPAQANVYLGQSLENKMQLNCIDRAAHGVFWNEYNKLAT